MATGSWGNIFILFMCMNIFMYIGLGTQGNFLLSGDLLDEFIDMDINKTDQTFLNPAASQNLTYGTTFTNATDFQPLTASGTSNLFQFLDALQVIKNFIKSLLNVLFAPLTLFLYGGMPFFVQLLMLPYGMLYIISAIQFVRGAS